MKALHWILLSASIAAAEMIPVLSEPLVVADSGMTVSTWGRGDTAAWTRQGRVGIYTRQIDRIAEIEDIRSDSIDAERAFSIRDGYSGFWVISNSKLTGINRDKPNDPAGPGQVLGANPWSSVRVTNYLEKLPEWMRPHLLVCGSTAIHDWYFDGYFEGKTLRWILNDSFPTPNGRTLCASDLMSGQGIWMWSAGTNRYAFRSGPAAILGQSLQADTLSASNLAWTLVDAKGYWLASDRNGRFYRTVPSANGGYRLDSTYVPELDRSMGISYGTFNAVRWDSLVVFGVDSTVILAKWTPSVFQILSKVSIPSRFINDFAIGQSGLWVNTVHKLYSFRWAWQESEQTNVRVSRLMTKIGIRSERKGVTFTSSGALEERIDLLDWSGRHVGSLELGSGKSVAWRPPHPGVYLARSMTGIQRFVAR